MYLSFKGNRSPVIIVSKHIKNIAFLRCVLAEELGHYFTSMGLVVAQSYFVYQDRINISKTEHRALKWAAECLIPIDELKEAISQSIVHTWELADFFTVTQQMMEFSLQLNDVKQLSLNVANRIEKHYF